MSRIRILKDPDYLPALNKDLFVGNNLADLPDILKHPPKILLLYGSLRERSFSRLAVEEAARILKFLGAEPKIFDPSDLPLPDQIKGDDHPAVKELRELSMWSEGQVWCSPERHGAITGVMKAQIDHLPLNMGGMRPTQGRTLAVMQVSGGSQSFNAVNTLRLLGRWMRMVTIPNQSSVAKAFEEFDEQGRMKPSSYYDRIVDVMEELVRFTVMLRPHTDALVSRYSERKEVAEKVLRDQSKDLSAIATANQKHEVDMTRVLVLCTGNSCRSVMAEALINNLGQGKYEAFSAGSFPAGYVHPKSIETIKRHGFDPGTPYSKSWDEFTGQQFDLVITVCDQAAGESCPLFLGSPKKLHWSTPDPAKATGTEAEIDAAFDNAFLILKSRIEDLIHDCLLAPSPIVS